MNAYKDRIAETERVKERQKARVERGAGGVLVEPGSEEQMADRHVVASGEDESQHDENRMRDIHIGKRRSETVTEEQPDRWRRTVRFEQEAPNTSSSSATHVSLEYPASGERQVFEMSGRESRYIKEVLGWYREEDAGDLKRSELKELVESMICLNVFDGKS